MEGKVLIKKKIIMLTKNDKIAKRNIIKNNKGNISDQYKETLQIVVKYYCMER